MLERHRSRFCQLPLPSHNFIAKDGKMQVLRIDLAKVSNWFLWYSSESGGQSMGSEVEIGNLLKTRREELGLSIEDVVQETKIRSKYLLAIETGDFHVIPGEVYLRGFIRSYAKYLNMDAGELLAHVPVADSEFEKSSAAKESIHSPEAKDNYRYPENTPSRRSRTSDSDNNTKQSVMRIVKILIIIAALLFSLNYAYENVILRNLPDPIENGGNQDPGGENGGNGPEEPSEPEPLPIVITVVSDSTNNAIIEVQGDSLDLTIKASARCWLRVQTDNNPAESQTMSAGDEANFTAESVILMRAGNSGGISIYIHDELLDVSSRSGGVKNYTITLKP
jgi:cytoskeleton protein RodZ